MFGRILAVGAAAILPALALVTAAPSEAASSGVTVAAGAITSPGGAAMPGVKVSLYAWPRDAVLSAMKLGQAVPRTLLATATSSSAGRYTLQVPRAKLTAATAATGYANLEMDTAAGIWFFSYQASQAAGPSPAPVTVNLRENTKLNCGHYPDGTPYTFLGFSLEHTRAPAWAIVGQGYILKSRHTNGDWVNFKYTEGSSQSQDSALGVGLSGYGFDAGYTSAGTSQSTATRAEGYAREVGSSWFRTQFKTGQYRGMCAGSPGTNVHRVHQHGQCPRKVGQDPVHKCLWLIHSRGWFGGQTTLHPRQSPRTPGRFCAEHEKGASFSGDFGNAVQWSQGFELGAALHVKGVNLKASFNGSAHTGYDSNAVMTFKFHQHGYLCGTNGSESTAAILVQRSNKAPS
jgi:hypothetical protein